MPITDKRPLKVFLCHASTDKPKVRELYRYLKKRGIQPWFDEEDLVGGQDWQVEIPKALATSDAIIICLTKNSVDKEGYIQKEIKFALDKALEMPEGRIFLIPVKFEECEVPFSLSRYQWVDLTVESGYAKMMKALKFRASQLERSTVEISKRDVKEENLAREEMEKETAEKAHLKEEEEERRKIARENEEQEFAQKSAREKLQREIDKRTKDIQRKYKREIFFSRLRSKLNQFSLYFRYYIFPAILLLGITAGVFYLGKPFFDKAMSPTQDIAITRTATLRSYVTKTVVPSETITPISTMPTKIVTPTPAPLQTEITDYKGVSMVLVDSFYLDKFEITNSRYRNCVNERVCSYPVDTSVGSINYFDNILYDEYPVVWITHEMAEIYCNWRVARLPSETEWKKAANGITDASSNFNLGIKVDGYEITAPVGSFPLDVSLYGVFDLGGNVSEWISELVYYDNGFGKGYNPVWMGGSWQSRISLISFLKTANGLVWNTSNSTIGFRCAKDVTP